jgi:Domain of Unknown Function with PDB structure (DUF3857)
MVALVSGFSNNSASAQQKTLAPADFVAWLPVSDAERQLKTPTVEKDAGAEVLFYRVHVVDELLSSYDVQRVFYHYVRLKVFDEKGKEKAGTIDLTYGNRGGILDVSGRTIKADGTILELDKKAVYKRDLVRAGGLSRKAISFAMPGVEPGAILEYRWRESVDDNSLFQVRLKFQREFPIEKVTYYFQPLPERIIGSLRMALLSFNCQPSPVKQENDGYSSISVENLPASRNEAFSPSEANLEAWALLHYQLGDRKDPDKYWNEVSKKEYSELKDSLKSNNEIKAAASEAVASAKNDDEKIAAIIAVVRTRVRNLYDDGVTDAERRSYLKSLPKERLRTASEIFKSGLGTANEMNVVFAAMAQQVGLEARPALVSDRTELLFHPKHTIDTFFLHNIDMAVKQGEDWKVYDVSTKLLPPGMISWREEGVYALIADPKNANFITTPVSPAEASAEVRSAHLRLSPDGTLEGDVEESYTGHRGEEYRFELNGKSPAQREEWLRDRIIRMFPDADVTELKIESVGDPTHPLRATYHLDAPHYAQVTGKRLLFQSSPFHRAIASPFSASERRFPVEFPYGWREFDEIHIQLPPEWALDNGESPGRMAFGAPGFFENRLTINKANELVSKREFVFGRGGVLNFEVASYSALKKAFDVIQIQDQHSLSLKAAN